MTNTLALHPLSNAGVKNRVCGMTLLPGGGTSAQGQAGFFRAENGNQGLISSLGFPSRQEVGK